MALLLARVVRLLRGVVLRPLDRLLGAVDDQRLGLAPADLRLAAERENGRNLGLGALDRAADRAAVHPVEKSQELLRDVTAIVEQQDQQVVFEAADLARAAGLLLAPDSRLPRAAQSRQHLIEGRDADAGEAVRR